MAEYIDRNLIEWYGCNFEDASCENRECSGCSHAECSHSQVMQIPTADVIERSEYEKVKFERDISVQQIHNLGKSVSKAIEEITNLVGYEDGIDTMNVGDDLMISWCKTLEILKRNIGE